MLELNRLTVPVAEMAEALSGQRSVLRDQADQARRTLKEQAQVTDELREKLKQAEKVDPSWRGADPLGDRLDELQELPKIVEPATLIASDGSQIYPDTHGIALYYLLNVGTIILRQGSGEAPITATEARVGFEATDLFRQRGGGLIDNDEVNYRRDIWELQVLALLSREERLALGGDLARGIVALGDGPLLPWMPQRLSDEEQRRRVKKYAGALDIMKKAAVFPFGYIDRPRSANILRLLHLAELSMEEISKERLRQDNPYRGLADRSLFRYLAPGQRSALFAATSEINRSYESQGHRIYFCFLNVANDRQNPCVVRVEVPEWIARKQDQMDMALTSVLADCRLTNYPYVLTRADELARVSRQEKDVFEQMLSVEMYRRGLAVALSSKQAQKGFTGLN
ncbi:MAG: DNA double-strand break repair nuclease NurA [Chloroflexota bacterium]|nr:DNA double-strand break repair nuclease NurA [Chloroflexota bacterium]